MPFNLHQLSGLLESIAPVKRLWLAFSGGIDSRVLLHHTISHRDQLPLIAGAIHVHHGLNKHADQWATFCQTTCDSYGLACKLVRVDARATPGQSPEQAARQARYTAFSDIIESGDVLLLAHHQDDQAETFLYQAIRGAGPHGLSAMPEIKPFNEGYLLRPMLNISRRDIHAYASENQLNWIEDESNNDTSVDRNFLRKVIFPQLQERWPAVSRTLSRSARHSATLAQEADKLLQETLQDIQGKHANTLSITRLMQHPLARAALLVRSWIRHLGLPMPSELHIDELLKNQLYAAADRQINVNWPDVEVRRYQDDLYFMPPLPAIQQTGWQHHWSVTQPCEIVELGGTLEAISVQGQGLAARYCDQALVIKPRSGGEKCRPVSRDHHHDLKKLFQEAHITPWDRARLPLIYVGDQLAAVADRWVCHEFSAHADEPGYLISWHLYNRFPD